MQAGTALSTFLPDHINNDSFMSNYSQAMIPGLVTGLTGIRYAPCLLRSSAVGAAAGATGVIFNPSLFAARPTGAGTLMSAPISALHVHPGSRIPGMSVSMHTCRTFADESYWPMRLHYKLAFNWSYKSHRGVMLAKY